MRRSDLPQTGETLTSHLQELRKRLIYCVLIVNIGIVACWNYSEEILDLLKRPVLPYLKLGGLVFTGVVDKFMAHFKVALMAGVIVTTPFWLFHIWKFIAPGLYKKERRYVFGFLSWGTLLFIGGCVFCYLLVLPTVFQYLLTFGGTQDFAMLTLSDYLSFVTMTMGAFGIVFEIPLILTILAMMGIIDQKFLRKNRRYAMVIIAIAAAVVTPTPDILNMSLMMLPMILFYEISVILAGIFGAKSEAYT